jgi:hypothetical protein
MRMCSNEGDCMRVNFYGAAAWKIITWKIKREVGGRS